MIIVPCVLESYIRMTIPFYDNNSEDFSERTKSINLTELYDTLAKYIPESAHILDAGCGSGRDSKAFLARGYSVSAFDASQEMVKLASEYTGLNVRHITFSEMDYQSEFDAVWANASLLHVPYLRLPQAFENIIRALKRNGMFYASFKIGHGEKKDEHGRHFTYFDETHMRDFVAQFPELLIEEIIQTEDSRPNRPDWLNTYMRFIE